MTIPMSEAVKYNRMKKRLESLEAKLEAVRKYLNDLGNTGSFIDKQKIMKILEEK